MTKSFGQAARAASFYATAYNWHGETIISYRGTRFDGRAGPDEQDFLQGWTLSAGFDNAKQPQLAKDFYTNVTQQPVYDGTVPNNFVLTGHSLGGGLTEYWVIPPKANAAFVAAMKDVLDVYKRPHDPARPLVCPDETSQQLVAETRAPEPMRAGQPARHDYESEYKRNGTSNMFMLFAPLVPPEAGKNGAGAIPKSLNGGRPSTTRRSCVISATSTSRNHFQIFVPAGCSATTP